MNRSIPVLNTSRVSLRAFVPGDFERYAEIWADHQVVRHIGGAPRPRHEAWQHFLCNAGHWQMAGFGQWGVTLQSSRRLVGQAGFFFGTRPLGDDFDPFPEAGWVLSPEAQGRGLGTEAARAAHEWFDRVMPGPLVVRIDTGNAASRALARRLGYRDMRQVADGDTRQWLMRRDGPPGRR